MAFQSLQTCFPIIQYCRHQSQLLRLPTTTDHSDFIHFTELIPYEYLTWKVTGSQSELVVMGQLESVGTLLSLKTRHLSGQGKPRSDRSSVPHIQSLLQCLGLMQLHVPSNSHLGTSSRIMHHGLSPITTSLFATFQLHPTSVR